MSDNVSGNKVREIMTNLAAGGDFIRERRLLIAACSLHGDENSEDSLLWSREEWLKYGYDSLDNFDKIMKGELKPSWDLIKFRAEKHFVAGSFTSMREIWLILIQYMNEDFKAEAYHSVFNGVNLYDNLKFIKESNPVKYKRRKIATFYVKNTDNIIQVESNKKGNTQAGAFQYPRLVLHPVEVGDRRTRGRSLVLKNPRSLYQHHSVVLKQILKWLESGAMEWVPPGSPEKPLLTSSIIVVPKGENDWRVCYNGNPVKMIEERPQPCTLDSLSSALSFIRKGDLLSKVDDKSGFHQLLLDPFSRNLAFCEYGGQLFRYRAAAFGFPKIPGIYQLVNGVPLNFLRRAGHQAFLYLDDRLFITRPRDEQEAKKLMSGEIAPEGPVLAALAMTACGTFLNRAKSTFLPAEKIEYLGFNLDTKEGIVQITPPKWEKFKQECYAILKLKYVPFKQLEQLRGKMASFAVVVQNMRLYIRRVTEALKSKDEDFRVEVFFECFSRSTQTRQVGRRVLKLPRRALRKQFIGSQMIPLPKILSCSRRRTQFTIP